jgi:hypothetical protein
MIHNQIRQVTPFSGTVVLGPSCIHKYRSERPWKLSAHCNPNHSRSHLRTKHDHCIHHDLSSSMSTSASSLSSSFWSLPFYTLNLPPILSSFLVKSPISKCKSAKASGLIWFGLHESFRCPRVLTRGSTVDVVTKATHLPAVERGCLFLSLRIFFRDGRGWVLARAISGA